MFFPVKKKKKIPYRPRNLSVRECHFQDWVLQPHQLDKSLCWNLAFLCNKPLRPKTSGRWSCAAFNLELEELDLEFIKAVISSDSPP